MNYISKRTIENINSLPLEEVIGRYLELRREGASYVAYSPFMEHRKRKLSVNPNINVWKCWITDNAGVGGISFLMKAYDFSFKDAVIEIANNHGVIIEYEF